MKPQEPYRKAEDAEFLPAIRAIVDARPTYGYRRVTALLNRELRLQRQPAVNAKRVLRMMQHHGLTLERHTASRPGRPHDGVVIALRSNVRSPAGSNRWRLRWLTARTIWKSTPATARSCASSSC